MLLKVDPPQHIDLNRKLSEVAKQTIHQVWPVTERFPYHSYILDIPFDLGQALVENMDQVDFEHLLHHFPELNSLAEEPAVK